MTSPADLKQLAPTGTLRGGVVTAPAASAFFAIRDGGGEVKGVTVDLIRGFAAALKLPLALQVYDNSGQVTDAVAKGDCDLAFMPQDAERAKRVDFGPAYYVIESTYLVPAGSSIKSIEEVNQPGRRIHLPGFCRNSQGRAFFPAISSRPGFQWPCRKGGQSRCRSRANW